MPIRDILVNLDIDQFSPTLVQCAVDLARRFDAGLIGHAAAALPMAVSFQSGVEMGIIYERERESINADLKMLEQRFRAAVPAAVRVGWRADIELPHVSAAKHARSADLIITGSNFEQGNANPQRRTNTGELLVKAGRPVLITGTGLTRIAAETVLVGWKDSREARRAVVDALPFLSAAKQVIVVTIHEDDPAEERASLDDVLAWMDRQGVKAEAAMQPASHEGAAETLEALGETKGADLIVTGGYGHGRMQEWLFGGMTRDLLSDRRLHRFMSN